jgi:hypothetical protein
VRTTYGESTLYGDRETDVITKTWRKLNKVSRPWKWGQGQIRHA